MRLCKRAAGFVLAALVVLAVSGAPAGLGAAAAPSPYDGTWTVTIGGTTTDWEYGYAVDCCTASQPVLIAVTNGVVSLDPVSYVPAFTFTGTIGDDGVGRFLIYIAGYNKTTASDSAPAGENPCSIQITFKLEGTGPGFADDLFSCRTDFTDSTGGVTRTVYFSGAFHALQTSSAKPKPTSKAKPTKRPPIKASHAKRASYAGRWRGTLSGTITTTDANGSTTTSACCTQASVFTVSSSAVGNPAGAPPKGTEQFVVWSPGPPNASGNATLSSTIVGYNDSLDPPLPCTFLARFSTAGTAQSVGAISCQYDGHRFNGSFRATRIAP